MAIYACPAEVDMTQELLKLALEALETELSIDWTNNDEFNASAEKMHEAITAIKEALAQPEQEPVAWMFEHDETGRMNYVSNDGIHNPTMFLEMNPRYALVCPLYAHSLQRTEQNFCSRCGKRVGGIDSIHTCTPPMENT